MKKIIAATVLLLTGLLLQAQNNKKFSLTLNHVALSVEDVNRSARFYGQTLGLKEITNRTQMAGIRWFSLGDGKELHLISTLKEKVTINKAVHLAMTTKNFASFLKMLQEKGIAYSDWPGIPNKVNIRADGIQQVFFQDPDGYWIEVNSVARQ